MTKLVIIGIIVLSALLVLSQQVKAFPTSQEGEERKLLNARFLSFEVGCLNELKIPDDGTHQFTITDAMSCKKSLKYFMDLTGATADETISLLVDRLSPFAKGR
jgi:hypothetical protein